MTSFKTKSHIRGKENLLDDKNITRFASYVNINNKDLEKLRIAHNNEDIDIMFDLISANSAYDINETLMSLSNYREELTLAIAKKVLTIHSHKLSPEGAREFKGGVYRPAVPPVKRPAYQKAITRKTVTQKQRSGRTYTRTKPTKFSKAENTYIHNNLEISNKEFVINYNKIFPNRTASSLTTKKYRVKKKK